MKKILIILPAILIVSIAAYAAEEKPSQGDFVSNTVGTVFDKLRSYSTGEKQLIDMDRKNWGLEEPQKPDITEKKLDNVTIRGMTSPAKPVQTPPAAEKQQ